MTKNDLIDALAGRFPQLSREDTDMAVRLILERMAAALVAGGRIEIRDFGRFALHRRPARVGRNPKTGQSVSVPGKTVPHFKPGKGLSEGVDPQRKSAQEAVRRAARADATAAAQKPDAQISA